jgi:hypothetical protein
LDSLSSMQVNHAASHLSTNWSTKKTCTSVIIVE